MPPAHDLQETVRSDETTRQRRQHGDTTQGLAIASTVARMPFLFSECVLPRIGKPFAGKSEIRLLPHIRTDPSRPLPAKKKKKWNKDGVAVVGDQVPYASMEVVRYSTILAHTPPPSTTLPRAHSIVSSLSLVVAVLPLHRMTWKPEVPRPHSQKRPQNTVRSHKRPQAVLLA